MPCGDWEEWWFEQCVIIVKPVGLGRRDRYTVVATGVTLTWLRR